MRQVPQPTNQESSYHYLIIGNGRAAKHITFYLSELGHTITSWHYKQTPLAASAEGSLQSLFNNSDRCLLLIKDSAIEEFLNSHPYLRTHKTVHCSGSLEVQGILNAHPLISFGPHLFKSDFYPQIPWAQFIDSTTTLQDILPGVPNPSFFIPAAQKPFYHGLCVVSGNFTILLWQMVLELFKNELHQSTQILGPYLESIYNNMRSDWSADLKNSLTGPLARRDENTLLKNYQSLNKTYLKSIFEAHVQTSWPEFASKHFLNHDNFNEKKGNSPNETN